MTRRFIDLYLDDAIPGWPCYSSPRFNNTVTASAGGGEAVNRNWLHPLHAFKLPGAVRLYSTLDALHDHWMIAGGREATFPFRDPLDFASSALTAPNVIPDFAGDDQVLGVGDGFTRTFQIEKTYERSGYSYTRPIYLPVMDSLVILVNGIPYDNGAAPGGPYTISVSRPGGEVTFTPALQATRVATWGGLFDVITRFERDDGFDGIIQNFRIAGFADVDLQEVRNC